MIAIMRKTTPFLLTICLLLFLLPGCRKDPAKLGEEHGKLICKMQTNIDDIHDLMDNIQDLDPNINENRKEMVKLAGKLKKKNKTWIKYKKEEMNLVVKITKAALREDKKEVNKWFVEYEDARDETSEDCNVLQ
jgi:hypothetical protein